MCTKKLLFCLCATGILLICGCASNKITVTPPVKPVNIPSDNRVFYRLNEAKISMAPYAMIGKWGEKGSSDRLTRLAEERYPGLFKNSPDAVPLNVQIQINQEIRQGAALATYLCTLCIVGGILPSVPWANEWQINANLEDGRTRRSAELQAVHRGWWSLFSPCGLITISGDSDIPAVSTVMTGGPGAVPPELCDYVMSRTVDLMAATLLNQNPSQNVIQLPGQTLSPLLSTPSQAPMALPLPTETVAPF